MFDKHTLIVSYDAGRGERRGSRKRGEDPRAKGLGDCIDCNICVQACPTGIDIREGLQYECIACAECVDACDGVMDRMGYPRGLVRYTTQSTLEGNPSKILRPRTLIYGTILGALFIGFIVSIANRPMLRVDVIRDRNAMFRESVDGLIENVYTLKLLNKDDAPHTLSVSVAGLPGATVQTDSEPLAMAPESMRSVAARVLIAPGAAAGAGQDIEFVIRATDDPSLAATRKSRFFAPLNERPNR
jgi:cytochrome c oxidase accessory protein FixG